MTTSPRRTTFPRHRASSEAARPYGTPARSPSQPVHIRFTSTTAMASSTDSATSIRSRRTWRAKINPRHCLPKRRTSWLMSRMRAATTDRRTPRSIFIGPRCTLTTRSRTRPCSVRWNHPSWNTDLITAVASPIRQAPMSPCGPRPPPPTTRQSSRHPIQPPSFCPM